MLRLAVKNSMMCLPNPPLRLVPPAAARWCFSSDTTKIVFVSPVPSFRFEEMIDLATPHFLGDDGLSSCFPPCTTGARVRTFQATARKCLEGGLGLLAVETSGKIVGGHIARALRRHDVLGVDIDTLGADIEDPQEKHISRFSTNVHQRLDLFSVLGVDEIVDMGMVFVEKPYWGRGLGTCIVQASHIFAAQKGYRAAKGDTTSRASTMLAMGVGQTHIYSVPFTEYTSQGEMIFAKARPPNDVMVVSACRLQTIDPYYIVPLTDFEVNQARCNYLKLRQPSSSNASEKKEENKNDNEK